MKQQTAPKNNHPDHHALRKAAHAEATRVQPTDYSGEIPYNSFGKDYGSGDCPPAGTSSYAGAGYNGM